MHSQNLGCVMRRTDINDAQDVVSIAIQNNAHILRQAIAIPQTETHISGVLRLLRGEEFTAFERPNLGPQAMICSFGDNICPRHDLFADGVSRDAF